MKFNEFNLFTGSILLKICYKMNNFIYIFLERKISKTLFLNTIQYQSPRKFKKMLKKNDVFNLKNIMPSIPLKKRYIFKCVPY